MTLEGLLGSGTQRSGIGIKSQPRLLCLQHNDSLVVEMATPGHQSAEPMAIYSPPSYPRERDALHPHSEKTTKAASQSVTSINRSLGSSAATKTSTCMFARSFTGVLAK
jgi:hypothetical protein